MNPDKTIRKTRLASAMALVLGGAGYLPATVLSDIYEFDTIGNFTMLTPTGNAILNTNITTRGANQALTPITGTLCYDSEGGDGCDTFTACTTPGVTGSGHGCMTIAPFGFFDSPSSLPADAQGIFFDAIGDGVGGPGTLLLGNMLFNWNGNNGIPVSIVWDAQGMLNNLPAGGLANGATISATGAIPAIDGTYVASQGAIAVGASPIASMDWDMTVVAPCNPTGAKLPPPDGCMGVSPSGGLPLVADTTLNTNKTYTGPNVFGISGVPMWDGPFFGNNANFEMTTLTVTGFTDTTPPVLTLGGTNPVNLNVGDTFTETVTCVDAVDGTRPITRAPIPIGTPLDTSTAGTVVLTYDCSDTSPNAALQQSRTVNISAQGAPAITLTGVTPLTFEAALTFTDPGATCFDEFAANGIDPGDGDIPLPTGTAPTDVPFFDETANNVVANVVGSYNVSYDCTDSDDIAAAPATRDVDVVDTTGPVITLSAACPIVIEGGVGVADPTPTATAADLVDGDLGAVPAGGDTVDTNPDFTTAVALIDKIRVNYNLSYSATDAATNSTIEACQITVGNPLPVVTLNGLATDSVDFGVGYTDPGANCADFLVSSPDAPDTSLTVTPDMVIDASTPAGAYTITYSCTDGDGNTGTETRSVAVVDTSGGGFFAKANTSGSTFVMLSPDGKYVGGAVDVTAFWDASLNTAVSDTNINMQMSSALPTPFFGQPWVAHTIRVFAPGSYTFDVDCTPEQVKASVTDCPVTDTESDGTLKPEGRELQLEVASNQIGVHMMFDWSVNSNIDVVVLWGVNGVFTGSTDTSDNLGAKGTLYNMVSLDSSTDGDGWSGTPMADGPFEKFSANFNVNFEPPYSLPGVQAPTLSVDQGVAATRTVIADAGVNATVTADTGTTFDWSGSDAALVAASTGTTANPFTFNPAGLAAGFYTLQLTVDAGTDDEVGMDLVIEVLATDPGYDFADDDRDGIPNAFDDSAVAEVLQVEQGGASIRTAAGTLVLGQAAFQSDNTGAGIVPATEDAGAEQSCIGGCFDFEITGLALGATIQVVLPLSEPIPDVDNLEYRKLINGDWRSFTVASGNTIASAISIAGICPTNQAVYTTGLNPGHSCVLMTIDDGGPNDADGLNNGVIRDPGGVAIAVVPPVIISTIGSASLGSSGCTLTAEPVKASGRADWWLLGLFTALLGWRSTRRNRLDS